MDSAEDSVQERLRRLVELQRLDERLGALEEEVAALPGRRAAAEAEREAAERARLEAREALEAGELERRRLEGQMADREALLQRLEGQTFQVKSNVAYTALLHEIEAAREAISQLETAVLEALEAVDGARARLAAAEAARAEVSGRLAREIEVLDARADELAKERERLAAARGEAASEVFPPLLGQYERTAQRRRPALVVVSEAVCSGCRVGIPPQSLIDLIGARAVVTCGSCQRILVHARTLDSPTRG